MMSSLGRAAFAAMLIVGAGTAKGQITTVVAAPPKKTEPAQKAAAQKREQAAQDSVARVTMTGMKEWVDSASAALAIRPDTVPTTADTAVGTPRAATSPAPRSDSSAAARTQEPTPEFKDGARAPDTATPIPAIGLAGGALILMGVAIKRRERLARSRAQS
jgi:hypothetical protein